MRRRETPYRSQGWAKLATTRERRQPLIVAMVGGGRSQRAREAALEKVLGHGVLSHSAGRTITATGSQADAAWRTRALRGSDVAYRLIATVDAP